MTAGARLRRSILAAGAIAGARRRRTVHSLHSHSGLTALQAPHDVLSFGPFELHLPSRELHNGSARTTLQGQPFEILRMLLERPGSVVTRDQLRQRLWPEGTFVDYEHSLNAAIKRLRAALGDDAQNPRFVETLARRGYRWRASDHATNARRVSQPTGNRLLDCRSACWEVTRTSATGLRRS
jgi:DNA-binding winged helix-turn-helix (wHTH) protein